MSELRIFDITKYTEQVKNKRTEEYCSPVNFWFLGTYFYMTNTLENVKTQNLLHVTGRGAAELSQPHYKPDLNSLGLTMFEVRLRTFPTTA